MKSWLFALGLALCCFIQANGVRFENADHEAMAAEKWYVRAVMTNCPRYKRMISDMKATPVTIVLKPPENLEMTMDMAIGKECKAMKIMIKKKNKVYVSECHKGGTKIMEEVEMNGNNMFNSANNNKGNCKIATFAANHLDDLTEEDLAHFRKFADKQGLVDEEIHILSTEGICPRSS